MTTAVRSAAYNVLRAACNAPRAAFQDGIFLISRTGIPLSMAGFTI